MPYTIKILFLVFSLILFVSSIPYYNKELYNSPDSEYHCSRLTVNDNLNISDAHCCFWKFTDPETIETIKRCSSIGQNQIDGLNEYIANKAKQYKNLEIKCTENQNLYCNNPVLDDEEIDDCS